MTSVSQLRFVTLPYHVVYCWMHICVLASLVAVGLVIQLCFMPTISVLEKHNLGHWKSSKSPRFFCYEQWFFWKNETGARKIGGEVARPEGPRSGRGS